MINILNIYLCYDFSSIYYLLLHIDVLIHIDTYSLILFSAIKNMPISVNNSNSILVFLKKACHASPGADKK